MKYIKYRVKFKTAVHFGNQSLDSTDSSVMADTLFSAIYIEALKESKEKADWLYHKVGQGSILFSDMFPYIGETDYLPKPMKRIVRNENVASSVEKKAIKKMPYIPMHSMTDYLRGEFDSVTEKKKYDHLGTSELRTVANVKLYEDTEPYHIGTYRFSDDAGLYFIVAVDMEEDEELIYDMIDSLSFTGLGGKRNSGMGKFEIVSQEELPCELFEKESTEYMTLSISLPAETEICDILNNATFQIKKRSGFVFSNDYAPEQRKKRDIYMIGAGACVHRKYAGDIYDVSCNGSHPVYRYGKGLFLPL